MRTRFCPRTFLPACGLACIFISLTHAAETSSAISWLADGPAVEAALLETGRATVEFRSSRHLTSVDVWPTPSLTGVSVSPSHFPNIAPDAVYSISLQVDGGFAAGSGGTILLRDATSLSRTFAAPFPIDVTTSAAPALQAQPPVTITRVAASADYRAGGVSARQILSIFGDGLGPATAQPARLDADGKISCYLGDTQVFFNGLAAPILAVTLSQVNVVVPSGIDADRIAEIVVSHKGRVSPVVTIPVARYLPALFTLGGAGRGQSAALNRDGSMNSASNRAARGSLVSLFGSGFGEFTSSVPDGAIVGVPPPVLRNAISVSVGGVPATVVFAGAAPGSVAGVVQINILIPSTVPSGDALEVRVAVGGSESPAWATLAVR